MPKLHVACAGQLRVLYKTAGEFVSLTFELMCAVGLFASQFPFISCFYTRRFQCLKLLYTGKDQSLCKAILFRPHYIQS